jgi:hypothetical protein
MDDEWEDIGEPGEMVAFTTTIECGFGTKPDPLTTAIEMVGGVALSALAIWFIVRLVNRRSLRGLLSSAP